MVKMIIILILALTLTACSSESDVSINKVTSDTTSTLSSTTTSNVSSIFTSQESTLVTSQSTSESNELKPVEVQTQDGDIITFYNEPIKKRSKYTVMKQRIISCEDGLRKLGSCYKFDVSDEEYAGDIMDVVADKLVSRYFTLYSHCYVDGLLPYDTRNGGYKLIGQEIYPVASTYMTKYHKTDEEYAVERYEGLCLYRFAYETFTETVAKEVLDNPTYNGKRYHYFEKDGKTYIDQSVAKRQGYLPYKTYGIDSTYKYDFYYYSFDYTVNSGEMNITVYIENDETNEFEQFTMRAVLENGEWRLAEFFDLEERVTVCDPQPK